MNQEILQQITELSHEFGTSDYVKGGGGNSSAKDGESVWVKPSGTTLSGITADDFVPLRRSDIEAVFEFQPSADPAEREAKVKELMAAAVMDNTKGRPSVEAPLHHCFDATYVVHTHPPLVNGMLCGKKGSESAARMFPDALWIDYIDPGYSLAVAVRERVEEYAAEHERQPDKIFIQNHGLFVAGDTAEEVRASYKKVMEQLRDYYQKNEVDIVLQVGTAPSEKHVEEVQDVFKKVQGQDAECIEAGGPCNVPHGPLTPDHIVYMKSHALFAEPSVAKLGEFFDEHGYYPAVVSVDDGVFALASTEKQARLALELALDGGLVEQLASAFGGVNYMSDDARIFIENWEVEAYRKEQAK